MKKQKKSIVSAFGDNLIAPANELKTSAPETKSAPPPPRVGAGVIGATQRSLTDIREERDRLQKMVEEGTGIVEVDPSQIDGSPIPDRLPDDDEVSFNAMVESMASEGQKVPVQLRRHPAQNGRYQIVYGHRRWWAARKLGIKLKAIIAELSDRDLLIAQGIENGNRQDLSWIERALFASRMEEAGIKPRDIKAALSIDDAEMSKLRSVIRTLPNDVIQLLGRCPKTGRPRWLELTALIDGDEGALSVIRKTLSSDKAGQCSSDERFAMALSALKPSHNQEARLVELSHPKIGKIGKMKVADKNIQFSANGKYADGFVQFLEKEMPGLLQKYADGKFVE